MKTFQCMAILHEDQFPGMREGKREYGRQIEVRCWKQRRCQDRQAGVAGAPGCCKKLAKRMTEEIPGVVSVTYNIAPKPPSTMEAV